MKASKAPIVLAGCAPDSGNLGVSALLYSLVLGLSERIQDRPIVLTGFGKHRTLEISDRSGEAKRFQVLGVNHSRRFYSPYSTSNIDGLLKLGLPWTRTVATLKRAAILLDISAGDSFSDIYGQRRLDAVCFLKEAMQRLGKPYAFLPQTYGPFQGTAAKHRARELVSKAEACWARDRDSYQVLQELLGDGWNAQRHHLGVDVAFLLPIEEASTTVMQRMREGGSGSKHWIGFNISGLVYNEPEKAAQEFGLKANYREVVHRVLKELLEASDHSLMLVSHVFGADGRDSDPPACEAVVRSLPTELQRRVWVAPRFEDPRQIKWAISQCDWFCGTRMHATIAGLSSGVPTASIAYSMKTRGVFESCGVADQVIDPRHLDTDEVVRRTVQSYHDRDKTKSKLAASLPATLNAAKEQMDQIAELCERVGNVVR